MKELFSGHFKESQENLKESWSSCVFVFDANILLNLYRYSDSTRNEFLRLLEKIKDRVWLPHRAAEEYLNNRLSVIGQQEESYDLTIKSIENLKKGLDNARQHPFVSKETMGKINSTFETLCDELKDNQKVHSKRILNDEIKESISKIFDNRVGLPFIKEELEKLITDGEERYKQKIPPGFKDASKSSGSEVFAEQCKKYGDLIVWKQVLKHSSEIKKGIVLVTDDNKEDWWERFKGKTIGPRPELIKEFKDATNNTFHMYKADSFLELARDNLNEEVSREIVEEIREVRRRDIMANRKNKEFESANIHKIKINNIEQELQSAYHEMMLLQKNHKALETEKLKIKEYRDSLFLNDHKVDGRQIDKDLFMNHDSDFSNHYHLIQSQLEDSEVRLKKLNEKRNQLEHEIAQRQNFISLERDL